MRHLLKTDAKRREWSNEILNKLVVTDPENATRALLNDINTIDFQINWI